jgi:hypothetical protein
MLGSQGCLFRLFGRGRRRRRGNRGIKVRLAEKVLRAELRQELGASIPKLRAHDLHRILNTAQRLTISTSAAY